MSFSQKTKNELARIIPVNKCCKMSELTALILMDGGIYESDNDHLSLGIETENAATARKIYLLCKNLINHEKIVSVRRNKRLRKNNIYSIRIILKPNSNDFSSKLGILFRPADYKSFCKELLKSECCSKAYLRGAFLGGGSISNPEHKTYHLEMITNDHLNKQIIIRLMQNYDLKPKITERKKDNIIYLKESEKIVDFLNIIGAHSALLYFEDVRIRKNIRNSVNRLVNCETANLNKTVEAGLKQVELIKFIDRRIGLENLPLGLRELARTRLEFPEVSLKELGEMMEPSLSKSGVNNRIRRLQKISEKLK
jgi:hypothetical protein